MALPLESVPNFSVGREPAVGIIRDAIAGSTSLLDLHADIDHNRSVFTVAAPRPALVEGLCSAAAAAIDVIDMRDQAGVHPRVGAVDVIPIVPLNAQDEADAEGAAREVAEHLAGEFDLPVFLYGELCPTERQPDGQRPAFYRDGGSGRLAARLEAGELTPDFGPARLHPSAGATLVGVRNPLIAFNVNLATDELGVARDIAAEIRERDGGFTSVRALGLRVETQGMVQVSMNIEDWQQSPPHRIVAAIREAAAARGVALAGSELVGLMPVGAALAAAGEALELRPLMTDKLLELRLLEETMSRQSEDG